MLKKAGIVFVFLGVVLMSSALLLFWNNKAVDNNAGEASELVMQEMLTIIEDESVPQVEIPDEIVSEKKEMTVKLIDGYEYIGYLTIPNLFLNLPVMAEWDYKRLKIAPCRQFGAVMTDDLVIAAHNYKRHFGRFRDLEPGDEVFFTDMDGEKISYIIARIGVLHPNAVDAVQYSEHDMVLYTCTYGGKERIAVFCDRK